MSRPDDLVLRPARRADLPALGRLGAALMRAHHGYDPRRFMAPGRTPEEGYACFLGTQLDEADAAVFVAERGGAVVGYAYATIEPRSWELLCEEAGMLHDLAVDEAARGGGLGSALLEHTVQWIRGRGVTRVLLYSAWPNVNAQRLFERLGFRRTMVEMTRNLDGDAAP